MNDDDLIRRGDALAACSLHNSARAAEITIAALPAAQVAVNPLVWTTGRYRTTDDDGGPLEGVPHFLDCWRANGIYTIIKQKSRHGLFIVRSATGNIGAFPALDAAKAAAQADYEARIRAALDVAPAPDVAGLVEALEAILEICREPAEKDHKNVRGWVEVTAANALAAWEARNG